jgi:hypothetical protein
MIAIDNNSGKITIRFLIFNRGSIFRKKTDPDFSRKTGSRLKNHLCNQTPVVNRQLRLIQISLTFHNRSAIFPEKTDRGEKISNGFRFLKKNRDDDRD